MQIASRWKPHECPHLGLRVAATLFVINSVVETPVFLLSPIYEAAELPWATSLVDVFLGTGAASLVVYFRVLRPINMQVQTAVASLCDAKAEAVRVSRTDVLTGIPNRRAFFDDAEIQWEHTRRCGSPLTCAVIDIDHFKQINDRHGHSVGDQSLQVVAEVLSHLCQSPHLLCRFGGEEFVILMADTSASTAHALMERIRQNIRDQRIQSGGDILTLSVSIGVAQADTSTNNLDELLVSADRAMYRAKQKGRDRVVVAMEQTVNV